MTDTHSFTSASEVNPPASATESTSVNSQNEGSTVPEQSVNLTVNPPGEVDEIPPDPDGFTYDADLFAEAGVASPEAQADDERDNDPEDDGIGFDDEDTGPSSFDIGCQLLARHLTVIPLDHPAESTCRGGHGPSNPCDGTRGKHPLSNWKKSSCRTVEDIEGQTAGRGSVNWGILTGAPSNLLVLDEDQVGHMQELCARHGQELPDTLRIGTGREGGGVHWWFRPPADAAVTVGTKLDGLAVDWRGEGGMVIAPGSLHQSGVTYTVLNPGAVIRPLPDWLTDLLRAEPKKQAARRKELREKAKTAGLTGAVEPSYSVGGRDNQVFSFCVWTKKAGIPLLRAEELLYQDWLKLEQRPGDPYPWELAQAKLRRVHGDERYAGAEREATVWINPATGEILCDDPDADIDLFAAQLDDSGQVVAGDPRLPAAPLPKPPIPLEEPAPQPYDLKRMGELGRHAGYVADNLAVPGGMVLMADLGAVSAAVGGRRKVRVRPGWTEPVVTHTLALAPPGSRKSAAVSKATEALRSIEKERRGKDRTDVEIDKMRRSILDDQIKAATARAAKGKDQDERDNAQAEAEGLVIRRASMGDPKEETRLLTSDITPEELAYLMARQAGRMAVIDSEAAFLSNISGRYSAGSKPKVDLVLNAYDQQAYTVDRVGRDEPVEIDTANLTIALAVQGDAITGLGKSCQEMDRRGTWGRYLYDVTPGHVLRTVKTPEIPQAVEDAHTQRIEQLMAVCYDSPDTETMTLSDEASSLFFAYYLESDPALRGAHHRVRIQGWEEKQPGRLIRIAALRTLYENPHATEIPGGVMADVIALDETMRQHAHKASAFMTLTETDPLEPARDVLSWLLEELPGGIVKAKTVLSVMRKRRRAWAVRWDDACAAVDVLEEYGHVHYFKRADGSLDRNGFAVSRYHVPDAAADPVQGTGNPVAAGTADAENVPTAKLSGLDELEQYAFETQEEELLRAEVRRISSFVAESCRVGDPRRMKARTTQLYDAYMRRRGGDEEGWLDPARFGRALARAVPSVTRKRLRADGGRPQFYVGIEMID